MKPILNKIAIIAGLSLLASCQSFFDEDPVYSTTTDTFFNSETALETYAIGFLESHLPSAATLTRGDQYSDICVTTQTEGFLKTGGYSAQQANNWARGNWRPLYNVNYYLKHMKDAAPYVDDATMKHYEGVGRFWRAWFYWDKVKTFGDVPWYDEPIDPDDDEQLYKGRDPRDYVMQKVLEDLDFAATWCSKASKYVNTNVINRYVALALKSRICLYEGTWRKYHGLDGSEEWLRACVAASEELMGDSPYSLVSTAGEETTNYSKVFKSEEPQYTEVILANEFNATLNRFHDASWYYASGSYGQRNSGPKAFVNMYLNLDGTRFTDKDGYNKTQFKDEFAGRDYRLRQTFITPYYVKKVGGKETNEFAKVFPRPDHAADLLPHHQVEHRRRCEREQHLQRQLAPGVPLRRNSAERGRSQGRTGRDGPDGVEQDDPPAARAFGRKRRDARHGRPLSGQLLRRGDRQVDTRMPPRAEHRTVHGEHPAR